MGSKVPSAEGSVSSPLPLEVSPSHLHLGHNLQLVAAPLKTAAKRPMVPDSFQSAREMFASEPADERAC